MEREELLFRRLERHIVAELISSGFLAAGGADVDGFLGFSLSVQNRRKARAGHALENHLEAVFTALGGQYVRGAETEKTNKPDFLSQGPKAVHDVLVPLERLTVLGDMSTPMDRMGPVCY